MGAVPPGTGGGRRPRPGRSRRALPDGDELTLRVEEEHQEVHELVAALERMPSGPLRAERVARLVEVLREDVGDEEDVLFPRLQQRVDVAELRRLGVAWEIARRVSPTRPHPTVSRRPPGNALSGRPLSLLDRSRDLLDATVRRVPAAAVVGQPASRALAAVAGLVERTAPARTGDRAPTRR